MVADELAVPVPDDVRAAASAIAGHYPDAAIGVLFYGSCLRLASVEGLMLDFYLIVSDYRTAYDRAWLRVANRMLPPNVFPFAHGGLSAKYAVLSIADFHRLCGPETRNVSVWARFAQPSRLVWARDDAATAAIVAATARAAPTLIGTVLPATASEDTDPLALWNRAFGQTYAAELRAERASRAGSVVDADADRYRRATPLVRALAIPDTQSAMANHRRWARRRIEGKLLSIARLAKASATFAGGIDYLVWKVNRHAQTAIVIRPWQRRWPIVAGLLLLPQLLRGGAIR